MRTGMITDAEIPVVRIAKDAAETIVREAQRSLDGLETGGVLLGVDLGGEISVLHAGGPGPDAQREPTSFLRDTAYATELALEAWQEDRSQWIGEWHTHPTGDLSPSPIDLESYLRHLADPELHLDRFLSLILSTSRTGPSLAVAWLIYPNDLMALPVETIDRHRAAAVIPKPQQPRPNEGMNL